LHPAVLRGGFFDGEGYAGGFEGGERIRRGEMGGVDCGPGFYDREDFAGGEIGEGEVVGWGEGEDVAFSCYGLGAKEGGGEV